ncbi:hypothetical protein GCM10010298_73590 [Streptomyces microflavus]|nr:hypothetical protein GCM10010298_73590 [Streptomyces microflavus]
MAEAQIILANARESGIVAIAQGKEHKRARTALAETGFRRDDDGVYHLPVDGTETMVADLVACAKRHRVTVHTSGRRFIGDAARDLASQLPGRWRTSVQIYSPPPGRRTWCPGSGTAANSAAPSRANGSPTPPHSATRSTAPHWYSSNAPAMNGATW